MTLVKPASARIPFPAYVLIKSETLISVKSEKEYRLIELLKANSYKWDWDSRYWYRKVDNYSGPIRDRAVEIIHALLLDSVPVDADEALIADAVAANYVPEQKRWIKRIIGGQHIDKFNITCSDWDVREKLYSHAQRITGARWGDGSVLIPAEQYEMVLDFADQYQFSLSTGAKDLVDQARTKHQSALVVDMTLLKPKPVTSLSVTPQLPQSQPEGMAAHLRDDT